jgi:hypothetical protein
MMSAALLPEVPSAPAAAAAAAAVTVAPAPGFAHSAAVGRDVHSLHQPGGMSELGSSNGKARAAAAVAAAGAAGAPPEQLQQVC